MYHWFTEDGIYSIERWHYCWSITSSLTGRLAGQGDRSVQTLRSPDWLLLDVVKVPLNYGIQDVMTEHMSLSPDGFPRMYFRLNYMSCEGKGYVYSERG